MILSPLTQRPNITLVKQTSVENIVTDWKTLFNIDVSDEFAGHETIYLYRCDESGLLFFLPSGLEGSAQLYQQLEKIDWYYMEDKLEYDWAEKDLERCRRVLEVGCGRGYFVERLRAKNIEAVGIEFNESACETARAKNLTVLRKDVREMASECPGTFDGVCAFQVLEHVPEPREFLGAMVELLAPGGNLVLSVPNADSFLNSAADNPLDAPPHHISRWNLEAFRFLEGLFPISLRNVTYEPLARYHVDWYLDVLAKRLDSWSKRAVCNRWSRRLMQRAWVRRCIRGHTLYVCFDKS